MTNCGALLLKAALPHQTASPLFKLNGKEISVLLHHSPTEDHLKKAIHFLFPFSSFLFLDRPQQKGNLRWCTDGQQAYLHSWICQACCVLYPSRMNSQEDLSRNESINAQWMDVLSTSNFPSGGASVNQIICVDDGSETLRHSCSTSYKPILKPLYRSALFPSCSELKCWKQTVQKQTEIEKKMLVAKAGNKQISFWIQMFVPQVLTPDESLCFCKQIHEVCHITFQRKKEKVAFWAQEGCAIITVVSGVIIFWGVAT